MNSELAENRIILLVDDNPTNLGVLFDSLSNCGFNLLVAEDGESALEQIKYAKPDIILLDIMMPGIDGFETCRRLKAEVETQSIPVIFMTALTDTVDKVTGFELGAVDYITKPIQPDEVLARVKTHLALQALQNQLQAQNQRLQQEIQEREKAEEALRVYLHAVSHDLRNPVTGMLMVFNNLLNTQSLEAGNANTISVARTTLERMAHSCDRQLKLIDSLLETQEGNLWGIPLQCQSLHLHNLTQRFVAEWQPMLAKNQATLNHHIAEDLPPAYADANQLWRVFENLIANSLKHNPPGVTITLAAEVIEVDSKPSESLPLKRKNSNRRSKQRRASITEPLGTVKPATANAQFLRCTVTDDGVGMTPEQCSRLFKLYSRGQTTRRTTGLGLGLYLCRQIITAHGGKIGISSSSGAGAQFWFTLPTIMSE